MTFLSPAQSCCRCSPTGKPNPIRIRMDSRIWLRHTHVRISEQMRGAKTENAEHE